MPVPAGDGLADGAPTGDGGRMTRGWTLRSRFVVVAAACLLPLLGVVLFVLHQSLEHSRAQLLDTGVTTAQVVARVLDATLEDNESVLEGLAATDAVRRLDATAAADRLALVLEARPSLNGLFLVAPDGRVVVAAGGTAPEPLRTGFRAAMERALHVGELGVSDRLSTPDGDVIAIFSPIRAEDGAEGQPVGAVGALLSVERLRRTVLPFARGDTVIAVVGGGEVIVAQAAAELEDADAAGRLGTPRDGAIAGTVGTYAYDDAAGAERLAAHAPVQRADWAALVTNPSPTTYGPNRTLLTRGLAALAAAVVATLILVVLLGEWTARPLRLLTVQAAALARGDFGRRVRPVGGGEVGVLSAAFEEMADRIETQVRDLEAAREERARQAEQLRELHRRTVRLQEDERRRIAAEIHDAVSPLVTAALYEARALRLARPPKGSGNGVAGSDARTDDLGAIGDLLEQAMDELRGVIFDLRPPDLDDIGVVAAIDRYVEQVRRTGLDCRLEVVGEPPVLTPEVRLGIYRIVQEALHNVLRHAGADEAVVRLEATERLLRVTVRDDGAGFDPARASRPTSLGLLSMRERAAAIGADLDVASRPGDGTVITITRLHAPTGAPRGESIEERTGEPRGTPVAVAPP